MPLIAFVLSQPQVGNNSNNIREVHDCLNNRMQALHEQLKTCFHNLIVREFSVLTSIVFAQCVAVV